MNETGRTSSAFAPGARPSAASFQCLPILFYTFNSFLEWFGHQRTQQHGGVEKTNLVPSEHQCLQDRLWAQQGRELPNLVQPVISVVSLSYTSCALALNHVSLRLGLHIAFKLGKQEFWVVQCWDCSAFQVQLAKQSNKFSCSVCHTKQSVKRIIARSNLARDAREVVQSYNQAQSKVGEEYGGGAESWQEEDEWQQEGGWDEEGAEAQGSRDGGCNKWAAFAEEDEVKWTVALPEPAPAGKAKCGGGKRKREQQQQQEDLQGRGHHAHEPAAASCPPPGQQPPLQQQQVGPLQRQALGWQQQGQPPRRALVHVNQGPQHQGNVPREQVAGVGKQWGPAAAGRGGLHAQGQQAHAQSRQPGAGAGGKWASYLSEDS